MAKHRVRVGLHARNDVRFPEHDFALVRHVRAETLKMMSFTHISVYERLRRENPDIEFIVRLYDDRIRRDSRPSPADFVARMVPIIQRLRPYANRFEIHNEPNHVDGIEGWGASDESARAFRDWYGRVLSALKKACPWAQFGFPGLALNYPHRDLEWLAICRDVIADSDWLGCHCYWQYDNMLSDGWGFRFKLYQQRFPNKRIEITEFGNSTPNLSRDELARQYADYYQALHKHPYLGSASAFIASSPDPLWAPFVWMREGGEMLPVVNAVRDMPRKAVEVPDPTPPKPPAPRERTFPETGKTVRGIFLSFFDKYGLDICGYPITEQIKEDGDPAQYFQRVGLEEYQPGKIKLKLVGAEAWNSRQEIARLQERIRELQEVPQASAGPAKPVIEDISDVLPTHASEEYPQRSLSEISQIVIHHTATSPAVTPQRIAEYSVRQLNRPGIIYHYFIAADGTIYQTNGLKTASEHAFGQSLSSVGVCFAGNFGISIPTTAQLQAGGQLCAWLLGYLRLPSERVVGLSELFNTQSPGSQWLAGQRWKDSLLTEVEALLEANRRDQSILIASQQARIRALEAAIKRLTLRPPATTPPARRAGEVSKPPIEDMIDTLTKHETKTYDTRPRSAIKTLVIHHSAVPPSAGPKSIANYHVNKLDWPGAGYHFMVGADGTLYQANTVETVSHHAAKVNPRGVGICFLGNFNEEVPPPAQLQAGAHLIAWLVQELDIALDEVKGHREFMQTACPGNQWLAGGTWKQMLHQEIARVQEDASRSGEDAELDPDAKPIDHYVLFWANDGMGATQDWLNAQKYISAFRPTVGFSPKEAAQAHYVTIIGGTLAVSPEAEKWLRDKGCKVDRIAGDDAASTKRLLEELVEKDRRFLSFEE